MAQSQLHTDELQLLYDHARSIVRLNGVKVTGENQVYNLEIANPYPENFHAIIPHRDWIFDNPTKTIAYILHALGASVDDKSNKIKVQVDEASPLDELFSRHVSRQRDAEPSFAGRY